MEVFRIREFIGNLFWIFYSPPEWRGVHETAEVVRKGSRLFPPMGRKRRDETPAAERRELRGRQLNALQIRGALQIFSCSLRILSGDKT